MQQVSQIVRWIVAPAIAVFCTAATAAVTCEQLGQLALSTEQLRDQGYSLPQIMSEMDKVAVNNKFSVSEVAAIKKALNDAFLHVRTSNEIAVECVESTQK